MIKPVIKWVGGKTQIIQEVFTLFPTQIDNYYELFLGGGSVLFALLEKQKNKEIIINKNIYAYDINETLINLYINIQKSPNNLINELENIKKEYDKINIYSGTKKPSNIEEGKSSKESFYYWTRQQYNEMKQQEKNTCKGSAYFIFLNKTCFRGLYRVGPRGMNVPFGNYKNPDIFSKEHILNISKLISPVIFQVKDFSSCLRELFDEKKLIKEDFIYMDPPYAPETKKSFVSYTGDGFNLEKHNELFNFCKKLKQNNINFLMSNSNADIVKNSFRDDEFKKTIILCKRSINSKNPDSTTNELLIYPIFSKPEIKITKTKATIRVTKNKN
jgi:DNA adenine methylase